MTNAECYKLKRDEISRVVLPRGFQLAIPVSIFAQEAETVHSFAQQDRNQLYYHGVDLAMVDDITTRAGALRAAEAEFAAGAGFDDFVQLYNESLALRDQIYRLLRYAFSDNRELRHESFMRIIRSVSPFSPYERKCILHSRVLLEKTQCHPVCFSRRKILLPVNFY